ncbi:hypothetical protein GCM10010303_62240 [Streptomyces purpurascens]|nr:hypothetical protein GCM10010303_62240 [Streptomyces purpurascens]
MLNGPDGADCCAPDGGRGNATKSQFPAVDLHGAKLLPDLEFCEKGLAAAFTYLEGESLAICRLQHRYVT